MTLLEVVVAMVIVAIGVLTVLQSQAASHRLVSKARDRERMAIISEGIMENLIAEKKIPSRGDSLRSSSGKLRGALESPNDDVSWTATLRRKTWNDTTVLVGITLEVESVRSGRLALTTERFWP